MRKERNMPGPRPTVLEIETIAPEAARKHIEETYTDGASALKFFDGYVAQREKALKVFDAELKKNEALADAFTKNPVGTSQERGLLGPLDRINLEALPNPFLPWPFPFCHFHYVLECRWEVHWVCIRIFGFRFCWPVYHLHCRWVVRLHCHF
jgi:hypothetical protein